MVMFTFSKAELYLKSMVVIELFYLVLQSFKKNTCSRRPWT